MTEGKQQRFPPVSSLGTPVAHPRETDGLDPLREVVGLVRQDRMEWGDGVVPLLSEFTWAYSWATALNDEALVEECLDLLESAYTNGRQPSVDWAVSGLLRFVEVQREMMAWVSGGRHPSWVFGWMPLVQTPDGKEWWPLRVWATPEAAREAVWRLCRYTGDLELQAAYTGERALARDVLPKNPQELSLVEVKPQSLQWHEDDWFLAGP